MGAQCGRTLLLVVGMMLFQVRKTCQMHQTIETLILRVADAAGFTGFAGSQTIFLQNHHCHFQECAMDGNLPIPWRVLGVSLFALLALYRFMILMVSLPPHREAPAHRCLQPFFIADTRELAKHMAEAAAANTDSWQKCYEAGCCPLWRKQI